MNRRLARIIAIALVAVLALTLLAGVLAASAVTAPAPVLPRRRVLVIGDSVLAMATAEIAQAMPDRQVTVDAKVNRNTAQGLDVATARGADADVVVVQLGTNDSGTLGIYGPRVERLLDALAHVPLVIWLTIREVRPYYAAANDLLRQEVATHPNLAVADWSQVADRSPEVFSGDGLHLRGAGPRLMATFVADQVARALPGDGGRPPASAIPSGPVPPPSSTGSHDLVATSSPARTGRDRAAGSRPVDTARPRAAGPTPHPARSTPWALVVAGLVALSAGIAIRQLGRRPPPPVRPPTTHPADGRSGT